MKNITDYIQQWANTYKDDMQNIIMPLLVLGMTHEEASMDWIE